MTFKRVKVTVEVDGQEFERVDVYAPDDSATAWPKVAQVQYSTQKLMQHMVNSGALSDKGEDYEEFRKVCKEEGEEE